MSKFCDPNGVLFKTLLVNYNEDIAKASIAGVMELKSLSNPKKGAKILQLLTDFVNRADEDQKKAVQEINKIAIQNYAAYKDTFRKNIVKQYLATLVPNDEVSGDGDKVKVSSTKRLDKVKKEDVRSSYESFDDIVRIVLFNNPMAEKKLINYIKKLLSEELFFTQSFDRNNNLQITINNLIISNETVNDAMERIKKKLQRIDYNTVSSDVYSRDNIGLINEDYLGLLFLNNFDSLISTISGNVLSKNEDTYAIQGVSPVDTKFEDMNGVDSVVGVFEFMFSCIQKQEGVFLSKETDLAPIIKAIGNASFADIDAISESLNNAVDGTIDKSNALARKSFNTFLHAIIEYRNNNNLDENKRRKLFASMINNTAMSLTEVVTHMVNNLKPSSLGEITMIDGKSVISKLGENAVSFNIYDPVEVIQAQIILNAASKDEKSFNELQSKVKVVLEAITRNKTLNEDVISYFYPNWNKVYDDAQHSMSSLIKTIFNNYKKYYEAATETVNNIEDSQSVDPSINEFVRNFIQHMVEDMPTGVKNVKFKRSAKKTNTLTYFILQGDIQLLKELNDKNSLKAVESATIIRSSSGVSYSSLDKNSLIGTINSLASKAKRNPNNFLYKFHKSNRSEKYKDSKNFFLNDEPIEMISISEVSTTANDKPVKFSLMSAEAQMYFAFKEYLTATNPYSSDGKKKFPILAVTYSDKPSIPMPYVDNSKFSNDVENDFFNYNHTYHIEILTKILDVHKQVLASPEFNNDPSFPPIDNYNTLNILDSPSSTIIEKIEALDNYLMLINKSNVDSYVKLLNSSDENIIKNLTFIKYRDGKIGVNPILMVKGNKELFKKVYRHQRHEYVQRFKNTVVFDTSNDKEFGSICESMFPIVKDNSETKYVIDNKSYSLANLKKMCNEKTDNVFYKALSTHLEMYFDKYAYASESFVHILLGNTYTDDLKVTSDRARNAYINLKNNIDNEDVKRFEALEEFALFANIQDITGTKRALATATYTSMSTGSIKSPNVKESKVIFMEDPRFSLQTFDGAVNSGSFATDGSSIISRAVNNLTNMAFLDGSKSTINKTIYFHKSNNSMSGGLLKWAENELSNHKILNSDESIFGYRAFQEKSFKSFSFEKNKVNLTNLIGSSTVVEDNGVKVNFLDISRHSAVIDNQQVYKIKFIFKDNKNYIQLLNDEDASIGNEIEVDTLFDIYAAFGKWEGLVQTDRGITFGEASQDIVSDIMLNVYSGNFDSINSDGTIKSSDPDVQVLKNALIGRIVYTDGAKNGAMNIMKTDDLLDPDKPLIVSVIDFSTGGKQFEAMKDISGDGAGGQIATQMVSNMNLYAQHGHDQLRVNEIIVNHIKERTSDVIINLTGPNGEEQSELLTQVLILQKIHDSVSDPVNAYKSNLQSIINHTYESISSIYEQIEDALLITNLTDRATALSKIKITDAQKEAIKSFPWTHPASSIKSFQELMLSAKDVIKPEMSVIGYVIESGTASLIEVYDENMEYVTSIQPTDIDSYLVNNPKHKIYKGNIPEVLRKQINTTQVIDNEFGFIPLDEALNTVTSSEYGAIFKLGNVIYDTSKADQYQKLKEDLFHNNFQQDSKKLEFARVYGKHRSLKPVTFKIELPGGEVLNGYEADFIRNAQQSHEIFKTQLRLTQDQTLNEEAINNIKNIVDSWINSLRIDLSEILPESIDQSQIDAEIEEANKIFKDKIKDSLDSFNQSAFSKLMEFYINSHLINIKHTKKINIGGATYSDAILHSTPAEVIANYDKHDVFGLPVDINLSEVNETFFYNRIYDIMKECGVYNDITDSKNDMFTLETWEKTPPQIPSNFVKLKSENKDNDIWFVHNGKKITLHSEKNKQQVYYDPTSGLYFNVIKKKRWMRSLSSRSIEIMKASAKKTFAAFNVSLEGIFDRIPSQTDQSWFTGKVVGFSNGTENKLQMSPFMIFISGADYDIDKIFAFLKTMKSGFFKDFQGLALDTPELIKASLMLVPLKEQYHIIADVNKSQVLTDKFKKDTPLLYLNTMKELIEQVNNATKDKPFDINDKDLEILILASEEMKSIPDRTANSISESMNQSALDIRKAFNGIKAVTLPNATKDAKALFSFSPAFDAFATSAAAVGKDGISIGAAALKGLSSYALTTHKELLSQKEILTEEKLKDIEQAIPVMALLNIAYENPAFGMDKATYDLYIQKVMTEYDLNIEHSALLSAATDNAKELLLATLKINTSTMSVYTEGLRKGKPITETWELMKTPVMSFCYENTIPNPFLEYTKNLDFGKILGSFRSTLDQILKEDVSDSNSTDNNVRIKNIKNTISTIINNNLNFLLNTKKEFVDVNVNNDGTITMTVSDKIESESYYNFVKQYLQICSDTGIGYSNKDAQGKLNKNGNIKFNIKVSNTKDTIDTIDAIEIVSSYLEANKETRHFTKLVSTNRADVLKIEDCVSFINAFKSIFLKSDASIMDIVDLIDYPPVKGINLDSELILPDKIDLLKVYSETVAFQSLRAIVKILKEGKNSFRTRAMMSSDVSSKENVKALDESIKTFIMELFYEKTFNSNKNVAEFTKSEFINQMSNFMNNKSEIKAFINDHFSAVVLNKFGQEAIGAYKYQGSIAGKLSDLSLKKLEQIKKDFDKIKHLTVKINGSNVRFDDFLFMYDLIVTGQSVTNGSLSFLFSDIKRGGAYSNKYNELIASLDRKSNDQTYAIEVPTSQTYNDARESDVPFAHAGSIHSIVFSNSKNSRSIAKLLLENSEQSNNEELLKLCKLKAIEQSLGYYKTLEQSLNNINKAQELVNKFKAAQEKNNALQFDEFNFHGQDIGLEPYDVIGQYDDYYLQDPSSHELGNDAPIESFDMFDDFQFRRDSFTTLVEGQGLSGYVSDTWSTSVLTSDGLAMLYGFDSMDFISNIFESTDTGKEAPKETVTYDLNALGAFQKSVARVIINC